MDLQLTMREIVVFGFALGALTLYASLKAVFWVRRAVPRVQAFFGKLIEPWRQQAEMSRNMLDMQQCLGKEILEHMRAILHEARESRSLLINIQIDLSKKMESLSSSLNVAEETLVNVSDSNRDVVVKLMDKILDKMDNGDKKVEGLGVEIGSALGEQVRILNETMHRFEAMLFSREFGDGSAVNPMNESASEKSSFIRKRMNEGVPQAFAESEWEQQLIAYRQTLRGDGLSSYNGVEEEIDLV